MFALFTLKTNFNACVQMAEDQDLGEKMARMVVNGWHKYKTSVDVPELSPRDLNVHKKSVGAFLGVVDPNITLEPVKPLDFILPKKSAVISVSLNRLAELADEYSGQDIAEHIQGYEEFGLDAFREGNPLFMPIFYNQESRKFTIRFEKKRI